MGKRKWIGIYYDGLATDSVSIQTCEAKNLDEAWEKLEDNWRNLMVLTEREARHLRELLDTVLDRQYDSQDK